jgi:hypothetical protein
MTLPTSSVLPGEQEKGRGWFLTGCLVLVAAVLLRNLLSFAHIGFYAEDAVIFSHYYDGVQPFSDVVRDFFGQPYKTLITSFFSWLFAWFDVRIQPYLYLWTGFVWGIAGACGFFGSGLIRSRTVLLLGPLLVGLVGFNHIFYYTTLIFVMYTCLIVLLALLFYPVPESRTVTLLYLFLFIVLPWAGPYSAVVIPASLLMLLLFWQELGRKRWLLLVTIISALAYYFSVQGDTTRIMRLTRLEVIQSYFASLLDRVIFFDMFAYVPFWWWLPVLSVLCTGLFLLRRDAAFIKNSIIMFAIIAGSFTLFYLSSKYPVYIQPKPCHRFISLVFWCIYLLYLVDHLFQTYGEGRVGVFLFTLFLAVVILADNRTYPDERASEIIPDTGDYVAAIHRMEQRGLKQANQYVIMRQYNYQNPAFFPWVQVGSRRPDASQILRGDFPFREKAFISPWEEVRPLEIKR